MSTKDKVDTGNQQTPTEYDEAIAERDWWNEIGSLFGTRVLGWTYRYGATFVDGLEIHDSRVAVLLHELYELRCRERSHELKT